MSKITEMFRKTVSVGKALLTGTDVDEERLKKRLEICSVCPKVDLSGDVMRCGVCGCKLKGDHSLVNLARYDETKDYGCKYPGGSRWKAAGV